jgi:predicted RNA methylase
MTLERTAESEIFYGATFRGYPEEHKYGKYWRLRYDIFSKFDQCQFDDEGLHSTKPERSCREIANLFSAETVLDAFCGIGGVSLALALAGMRVIAADIDEKKIRMAEHNSIVYGCRNNITFHVCDAKDSMRVYESVVDGIYIDPPWGGADYINLPYFLFSNFLFDGIEISEFVRRKRNLEIGLGLPKNFQLHELAHLGRPYAVHAHHSPDRNSFLTAFFPRIRTACVPGDKISLHRSVAPNEQEFES